MNSSINSEIKYFSKELENNIKNEGLIPLIYYNETSIGSNVFFKKVRSSVCLLIRDNKVISRGVTVCSYKDNFSKRVGRETAIGRAFKAYKENKSLPVKSLGESFFGIVYVEEKAFKECGGYKYVVNPELTEYEKRIFNNFLKFNEEPKSD